MTCSSAAGSPSGFRCSSRLRSCSSRLCPCPAGIFHILGNGYNCNLHQDSGLSRIAGVTDGVCQRDNITIQRLQPNMPRLLLQQVDILQRHVQHILRLLHELGNEQTPVILHPAVHQLPDVLSLLQRFLQKQQRSGNIVFQRPFRQISIELHRCSSQKFQDHITIQQRFSGAHALLQQAQRISHRPVCIHRQQSESVLRDLHPVRGADPPHVLPNLPAGYTLEIQAHAPGKDGRRKLLRIRGCQDENNVCRRFLQRFQKRVERVGGHHMNLVDDVNLLPADNRRIIHALAEITHILHTVVGCRIDLNHIDVSARRNVPAGVAYSAGLLSGLTGAVHRLGQNPRHGRLPGAPRPAEQIRVCHCIRGDLMPQNFDNVLLPENLRKCFRAVFSVQSQVLLHDSFFLFAAQNAIRRARPDVRRLPHFRRKANPGISLRRRISAAGRTPLR